MEDFDSEDDDDNDYDNDDEFDQSDSPYDYNVVEEDAFDYDVATTDVDKRVLPEWLSILKHHAAGTQLFQANDVSKAHSTMNTLTHNFTEGLLENRDEGLTPDYITTVKNALSEHSCPQSTQRTLMKFFLNAERWIDQAFRPDILRKGWSISGQWPWNLRTFLKPFAGFSGRNKKKAEYLDTPENFKELEDAFHGLIYVAYGCGVVHKSVINFFLGDWIQEVERTRLSLNARYSLALGALKNSPAEDRNVSNYGSTILTNTTFRQSLKHKAEHVLNSMLEEEKRKESLQLEIDRKAQEDMAELQLAVDDACNDIDLLSANATWKKRTVAKLLAVARVLLPPEQRGRGHALPTKKGELITLLTRHMREQVTLRRNNLPQPMEPNLQAHNVL